MPDLKRHLNPFSCAMLVAGNMIGIGIFVTAGRIYTLLPNPMLILLVWLLGGALSLVGGLAYAEMASRFPRAGGGYVFLREAFGPFWGFLSGFSSGLVTIPGTIAFLAMGVSKYAGITTPLWAKCLGFFLIAVMSYINYLGVVRGARLQNGFMMLKFSLIFILIVAGFASMNGSFAHFTESVPLSQSPWILIVLAMVPVMYTYSGWDATVYVAGEVDNPRRTLPLAMFWGAFLVTAVYVALVSLYLYAVGLGTPENKTVIVTVVSGQLFGPVIGAVAGGLVALSVLGCLAATILTGPRVLYAMSRDGLFPAFAGMVDGRFFTPARAILFQAIWSSVLVVSGTFDQLLDYVTVPSVFFGALNVMALFVLRQRDQQDPGVIVYRMLGYPILPALFVVGMLGIVVNTVWRYPLDSGFGLLIVALGGPVYWLWNRVKR